MNKKGQRVPPPGSAAGALIGLITLVIIFYIILIPAAEREKLLASSEPQASQINRVLPSNVLLSEQIGMLYGADQDQYDHRIPNMLLKDTTESILIAQENSFMIKKGLSAQYKTITFNLADPENTDNVLISFNLPQHTGTLKLILNGNTVFEGEITTTSPAPIKISKRFLQAQNTLQLEVHGFGVPAKVFAFENFKIIGDVMNVNKQQATHLISITEAEYSGIEKAYLDYMPICSQKTIGNMEIYVNTKQVFAGIPECNSLGRIELAKEELNLGRNEIKFKQLTGTNSIEQARLKTTIESRKGWSSYFYITDDTYNQVQRGKKIVMDIEFTDDGHTKIAQTSINSQLDSIDQTSPYSSRDISRAIKKGKNYAAIKPENNMNIIKAEIRIE